MKYFSKNLLPRRRFSQFKTFNTRSFRACLHLAGKLSGLRVIHVNSARFGGVAELLKNQMPLEQDLGLDSNWFVLRAPKQFFRVTKKIHNLLQGESGMLTVSEKRTYLNHLHLVGDELSRFLEKSKQPTILVLHDPQTLPVIDYLSSNVVPVCRLHVDLTAPNKLVLDFLKPYLKKARRVIISNSRFRPAWLARNKTVVSYPTIDPFADKNRELSSQKVKKILSKLKIKPDCPMVAQVSRFDPWKDPLGVIEAYYLAKKYVPNLQLVLEGVVAAQDDPQGAEVYQDLQKQCRSDNDIHLFAHAHAQNGNTYDVIVNAIQRAADVVVQKSIREGFGLTVAEAMWKGKAVIGGNVGGIRVQIQDGQNGFLVDSPEECAEKIVQLLNNRSLAQKMGRRAHQTVREKFLIPKMLEDFLQIYRKLV